MKSRTLLITLFFITGITFQNCDDGLDCDFGPAPDFFDIMGMDILHTDSRGASIDTSTISLDDYGSIFLSFDVDYIAYQERSFNSFSLMNSAYGCSPPEPGILGSKEEAFENITIITLNDFDENHAAMDTINDVLLVSDFVDYDNVDLSTFLDSKEDNVSYPYLEFRFSSAPNLGQEFQVKIIVDLSTGETFEAESAVISFQ